jgi:hypothetical protein
MEDIMSKKILLPLLAGMMIVCGGSAGMAQSYGPTDPAWADTTDPNSTPGRDWGRPRGPFEVAPPGSGYRRYRAAYSPGPGAGWGWGGGGPGWGWGGQNWQAQGQPAYRTARAQRRAARAAAAQADPAYRANQETAAFLRDAMNPWAGR